MRELIKSIKDNKIKKLVKHLLLASLFIGIIGIIILLTYYTYSTSFIILKLGVFTIQASIVCSLFSIMCGVFFDDYLENPNKFNIK